MASTTTNKRKRNQGSYAVAGYFDGMDLGDEILGKNAAESDGDHADEDTTFGLSKKATPKKKKRPTMAYTKKEKLETFHGYMALPPELRIKICEFALIPSQPLTIVSGRAQKGSFARHVAKRGAILPKYDRAAVGDEQPGVIGWKRETLCPNLLAVDNNTRNEAGSVLYNQVLVFKDMAVLHTFLDQIGEFNRQLIWHVTVKGWCHGGGIRNNYAAFSMLSFCANLKALVFDCTIFGNRTLRPSQIVDEIYREGHRFIENIGRAKGRDAVVDILQIGKSAFTTRGFGGAIGFKTKEDMNAYGTQKQKEFSAQLRHRVYARD